MMNDVHHLVDSGTKGAVVEWTRGSARGDGWRCEVDTRSADRIHLEESGYR